MIPLSSSCIRPAILRGALSTSTAASCRVAAGVALTARHYSAVGGAKATTSSCSASNVPFNGINNNNNNLLSFRRSFSEKKKDTGDDAAIESPLNTQHDCSKHHHHHHHHQGEDPAIDKLMEHNRNWVQKTNEQDPDFFPEQGKGQSPEFLYIGCSDSRVAISALTGLGMGKVFVHRNIANMVVSADLNLLSVLTYAVEHLKVKHILVTGHYDCGGIRASMQKKDYGQVLDAWLQNIRDVYRLHRVELDAMSNDEMKHRRLVELNVLEQCLNLYKTRVVQKRRLETYSDPHSLTYPRIHGLVFDPATGILKKIPIDFRHEISDLAGAYDLFDVAEFEKSLQEDYVLEKKPKATD